MENSSRRRTNAKGTLKPKKKKKQRIILMVIIALLIGVIAYLGFSQVVEPVIKGGQPLSIMIVGSDVNTYREEHYGGTKPEKTDSIMVLTFNPDTYRVVITSIPRDTAVDYACGDIRGKINEQYAASGNDIDCLEKTVENYLNIPIDYYAKVNMDQLADVITEVGPLEIKAHAQDGYLSQKNVVGDQEYSWVAGETYTMEADEALTYARARHDSEKDYGRGKRQQQVISALAKNLLSEGINLNMISTLLKMVDTDMKPLLLKKYYDYTKDFSNIQKHIKNKEPLKMEDLNKNSWKNIFEYFDYSEKKITESSVEKFQIYLIEKYSQEEISGYFFERHQFYNDTYGGFYITPSDQLDKISNALRLNLNLKKETPKEPEKPFGTNNFGPEKVVSSAVNGTVTDQSGTTYNIDSETKPAVPADPVVPVEPTPDPIVPVEPTPEPVEPTPEPVEPTPEPVVPVEPTPEPVEPTPEPVVPVEPTPDPIVPVEPTPEPVIDEGTLTS